MRYLWILCLLMSPCFAKEIYVKQGWTIVLPNAKASFDKGTHVEGYNEDGQYVSGNLKQNVPLNTSEEVKITVREPGGVMVEVADGYCFKTGRGKTLYLEKCGGSECE